MTDPINKTIQNSDKTEGGIVNNEFYNRGNVKDDNEFFHITCHVDPQLFAKIERGEICGA